MYTQYDLYFLTAQTALHPGAGRSEFSSIDHQIQRDFRGWPTIRSSSIKGALREYLNHLSQQDLKEHVFGGNYSKSNQVIRLIDQFKTQRDDVDIDTLQQLEDALVEKTKRQTRAGHFQFHDAHLFSIPVRSNAKPFFNVTSIAVLRHCLKTLRLFEVQQSAALRAELNQLIEKLARLDPTKNYDLSPNSASGDLAVYLEDFEFMAQVPSRSISLGPILSQWLDHNLVLASADCFKILIDDFHLPILPRNSIEKGESKNLWYEQVLAPESRFYTLLGGAPDDPFRQDFTTALHQQVIGIGANLSVGYGCCYFEKSPAPQNTSHED